MRSTAFSTMRCGNRPSSTNFAVRALMPPMWPVWWIDLPVELATRQHHLLRVDDDDVVAAIDMGRVGRLVLAAQPQSDDRGEPADDEALRVDQHPSLLDLGWLGRIGLHLA